MYMNGRTVNFLEQKGKMNRLFDDFLARYWALRVALRGDPRRSEALRGAPWRSQEMRGDRGR